MSEINAIDTALAAGVETVVEDLKPAAASALADLKDFVHGQADRLRTALPALEQAAVDHVRGLASGVLAEYEKVVHRIEAHLGLPVGTTIEPDATGTVSNPAPAPDETPAPATEPEGTAPDPAEPITGMAPPAGQPTAETTPVED